MSKRLRMLPAFLMLIAGTITSSITYVLHYEGKTALTILLGVLLLFYIIGKLFQMMIARFENQVKEEQMKQAKEKGVVALREADGETQENGDSDKQSDTKQTESNQAETKVDVEETREQ